MAQRTCFSLGGIFCVIFKGQGGKTHSGGRFDGPSRFNVSRTVEDATPTRRAISLPETPAAFNRSTSRTWRIAILSAGIVPSDGKSQRNGRYADQQRRPLTERLHPGMPSDIKSEQRAT
jgi:hypothetical protein